MTTKYPAIKPAAVALLQQTGFLLEPCQQPALQAFISGQIGSETTVYRLLVAAREEYPERKRIGDAEREEREERLREQLGINESLDADSPIYVECGPDGKPLNEQDRMGVVSAADYAGPDDEPDDAPQEQDDPDLDQPGENDSDEDREDADFQ